MKKFCVFCGKRPKTKSNEHVISNWLIKLTGNPKRVASIHSVFDIDTLSLTTKELSFDQFKFPACETCNHKYSDLENKSKEVVTKLINNDLLGAIDFVILLDFLDKTRIGLWLGFNYLQKNIAGIAPNYFIENRIAKTDRAVLIYKTDYPNTRLSFGGVGLLAFQYQPICFILFINQYVLFNLSTDFLISKKIGLPYLVDSHFTEGKDSVFVISDGKEKIQYPLLSKSYNSKCSQIYQPIFSKFNVTSKVSLEYLQNISSNPSTGFGKIFIAEPNKVLEYPSQANDEWIPKFTWNFSDLNDIITKQLLEFQIYFLNKSPRYDGISQEKKELIKQQHSLAKWVNRQLLKD